MTQQEEPQFKDANEILVDEPHISEIAATDMLPKHNSLDEQFQGILIINYL